MKRYGYEQERDDQPGQLRANDSMVTRQHSGASSVVKVSRGPAPAPAPRIIRHFCPGSWLVGPGCCCCKRSRCIFVELNDGNTSTADVSSERERVTTCYRPSVCRLSVTFVHPT